MDDNELNIQEIRAEAFWVLKRDHHFIADDQTPSPDDQSITKRPIYCRSVTKAKQWLKGTQSVAYRATIPEGYRTRIRSVRYVCLEAP